MDFEFGFSGKEKTNNIIGIVFSCINVAYTLDTANIIYIYIYICKDNKILHLYWIKCSGDIDGRVPVTSTKYSIKKMNLPVKTAWHAWYLNGEVYIVYNF